MTPAEGGAGVRVRIGTQGWNYPGWQGPLYPGEARPADYLRVYARAFATVEVDSTFYAVPPSSTVQGWVERTPPGFAFALKLPQAITHERRLRDVEELLDEFFDRARELGDRLGPVLVQLGPDFSPAEVPALIDFLPLLPTDLKIAVEFRQHAWMTEATLHLLETHKVALALTDGRWIPRKVMLKLLRRPTAGFHYLRWMGPNRDITDFSRIQVDRSEELDLWAEGIREIPHVEVYGYFNNHFAGHSPESARQLMRRLGQDPPDPAELATQTSLF